MLQQILEFFSRLWDTSDWPARWNCGKWSDFHGWLYITSDLMVAGAYFAIPVIILRFLRKKELAFPKLYILFASFILACGLTHFIDALMFWAPVYRMSALVRFGTGIISWVTALSLIQLLPAVYSQRTSLELEREILQRKEAEAALEEKNRLLRQAQQIAKIGHWERSQLNGQTYVNGSDQLFALFGLKPADNFYTFENLLERIHPDDKDYVRLNSARVYENGILPPFFYRIQTPEGEIRQVMAQGEALYDEKGDIVKIMGILQDITQTKVIEQELMQKTRELESRIGDLQRFTFVASHDLKEPLRKIGLFASMLQTMYSHDLPDRAKQYLLKILETAGRHQSMVDELMILSRITNETTEFQQHALTDLANQALADIEVLRQEAEAEITIHPLPTAEVAPLQIKLLFQNLLTNALKFRRPDTACRVEISSELIGFSDSKLAELYTRQFSILGNPSYWEREQFCRIIIQDNGTGFEPEFSDAIFEIFRRLHRNNSNSGSGLGLAICKRIVENHHGAIEADGALNQGARFTIVLPLRQQMFL